MYVVIILGLTFTDVCMSWGGYHGHGVPGPHGYMAQVDGECGCCPPPCCCNCMDIDLPPPTSAPKTTTEPTGQCKDVLDICYIIESTENIGKMDWPVAIQFFLDLTSFVPVASDEVLVSTITYSDTSTVHWDLSSPIAANSELQEQAFWSLPLEGGGRNTAYALAKAYSEVFHTTGDRSYAPNAVVIVISGTIVMNLEKVKEYAEKLKEIATVIVVGVTLDVNQDQLEMIASPGEVYQIENLDDISEKLQTLMKTYCKLPEQPKPEGAVTKVRGKECFCCCPPPPGYPY